ncbi:alpha-mannosidase [Oscillatoriales cyanobacterium USR001]|nr:alpha-mannosidase [Oscillatoriales cyanobacterium USR001]
MTFDRTIEKLRRLTQLDVLTNWRFREGESAIAPPPDLLQDLNSWPIVQLNHKRHIPWSAGQQVLWLGQKLIIPHNLHGYPLSGLSLRIALTWWAADTRIFVNGELVQSGDLFDATTRLLLTPKTVPGTEISLALRLVSPSHDAGALTRSLLLWESSDYRSLDPAFVADELENLQILIKFTNSHALRTNTLYSATNFVKESNQNFPVELIDWAALPDREKFERSLFTFRQSLLASYEEIFNPENSLAAASSKKSPSPAPEKLVIPEMGKENLTENPTLPAFPIQTTQKSDLHQFKIHLVGHAHLDLAWLWPVSETWEVAQRTFTSAINLLQEFPDLIFCHSTPALYDWIEKQRPDLFAEIKKQVANGRWEIVGGTWVEPELNLISGESIVRQVFYGQRYTQEKFGELMRVAWLPDTFGFCWQLPQIFKQGGINYFVTQKLRWNDTTEFPYHVFWWESPDGSQIFSLMSAPIGEGIDPVKMVNYVRDWQGKTGLSDALWLPGVGDHGGGPTRDMLELAKRWQNSPFFPELGFTKAVDYLSLIEAKLSAKIPEVPLASQINPESVIPVWRDELYLEFHRGCYTSHADQKWWNRRCEELLYEAELLAALASLTLGKIYPKTELEIAWKQVLFNQFHDILPGSAIAEVYQDANQTWQEVAVQVEKILTTAMEAIASQIFLPSPPHPNAKPIIILNTLNWSRSEVVAIPLPASTNLTWQVCDLAGNFLDSQLSAAEDERSVSQLFLASDIPAVGYRVFWLYPQPTETLKNTPNQGESQKIVKLPQVTPLILPQDGTFGKNTYLDGKDWVLENQFIRVKVAGNTGDLSSIYDKVESREVLNKGGGNQLQAFQDSGQYWDAWNIDPNYAKYPLLPTIFKDIYWIERGNLQQKLRVIRQIGESEFCQDYILQASSPILKITTVVNWQSSHILVKAAFSLNLEAEAVTYEIPCGAIERKTRSELPAEQAKWEVSALRWADITANGYGVSLLNNCKYGYDATSNQLRLSLLRGSTWPDEQADRGVHHFTYALYPHAGSWQKAETVKRGYELNLPLKVKVLEIEGNESKTLPTVGKLLDLSAENLVLMAFKQSEDDDNQWILRCYECCGEKASLELKSDLGLTILHPVNLLEELGNEEGSAKKDIFQILPWKIASFAVTKA